MDVVARWAPTGLHVRLLVHHDGEDDLERLTIGVWTDQPAPVPCRLLPGNGPGGALDLTRVAAGGRLWMNVEPIGPVTGSVDALRVEVRAGQAIVFPDASVPIEGGDV